MWKCNYVAQYFVCLRECVSVCSLICTVQTSSIRSVKLGKWQEDCYHAGKPAAKKVNSYYSSLKVSCSPILTIFSTWVFKYEAVQRLCIEAHDLHSVGEKIQSSAVQRWLQSKWQIITQSLRLMSSPNLKCWNKLWTCDCMESFCPSLRTFSSPFFFYCWAKESRWEQRGSWDCNTTLRLRGMCVCLHG